MMEIRELEQRDLEAVAFTANRQFKSMGMQLTTLQHTLKLAQLCFLSGMSKVLIENNTLLGGIGAFITPNLFQPLKEIVVACIFIEPHLRQSGAFYKLWKAFEASADIAIENKEASRIVVSHVDGHTGINWETLGFHKSQTTYMREG